MHLRRITFSLSKALLVATAALGAAACDATVDAPHSSRAATTTARLLDDPGTVSDLAVVSTNANSVTLTFHEVDDGTGNPAKYDVRFAPTPISWGSAPTVEHGSCSTPLQGVSIGAVMTCNVTQLSSETDYDFQLVAYRGTLDLDAVFGGLSNVAQGTTAASGGFDPPDIMDAGFESSGQRENPCGWPGSGQNCAFWGGVFQEVSYTQSGCRTGSWCGAFTLSSGVGQANRWWVYESYAPPTDSAYYVRAAFKYPTDWRFPDDDDWKLILLRTGGTTNSFYVNLQRYASLDSARIRVTSDRHGGDDTWFYANQSGQTGVMRADGLWHTVEVLVDYPNRHWSIWLDGALALDYVDNLMGGDGASQQSFGGRPNGTASATHTFYVDDIAISRKRIGP